MRYHWIRDQVRLGYFTIVWQPGKINLADLFAKAHPVHHHLKMIETYSILEEGVLEYVHITSSD